MSRIFDSLKPVASNSRNSFDKSRRDVFSAKLGMLNPCLVEDTIPDAVYDVSCVDIIRTDAIQSAPFARMSQNMEYYFVPYSQIYRDFDRLYYERGDKQRNVNNLNSQSSSSHVPMFELNPLVKELFGQYVAMRITLDWISFNTASLGAALMDNVWLLFDEAIGESDLSFTVFARDVHNRLCIEDMLRIFDMLGYGNLLPVFKRVFALVKSFDSSDYDAWLQVSYPSSSEADRQGFKQTWNDLLYSFTHSGPFSAYVASVFPSNRYASVFRLAAYLKIWSDIYRNSQYDVSIDYSYYFNFDYSVSDSLAIVSTDKILELLKPRYRQYKKDIFTGCYPTAQFGSVAVAATENPFALYSVDSDGNDLARIKIAQVGVYNAGTYVGSSSNRVLSSQQSVTSDEFRSDQSVSALSIRQAMALQRYRERILRAGNRTSALQRAVFGDTSRYVKDDYVDFIGACHSNIDFNSVAATNQSENINLGELGSNGVSTYGGKAFEFHSHDHGIIMGIFYILPETEYESYGIDYFNIMTESSDFYKPDFANLGLAPVFNFNFNNLAFDYVNGENAFASQSVLGYLARYWQYKTSVDRVHGEFYSQSPFYEYRTIGYTPYHTYDEFVSSDVGAFADYVTPRASQSFLRPFLRSLYVSPSDCDRIFYSSSDEFQASDKFKINMNHGVKCVLPMSVIGLPQ